MTLRGFDRRVDELERRVPRSTSARVVEKHPELDWMTVAEMLFMEEAYQECGDDPELMSPATKARALSIWHGARARMLSGAPRDVDLPYGYDLARDYEESQRELRARS